MAIEKWKIEAMPLVRVQKISKYDPLKNKQCTKLLIRPYCV